MYPSPGIPPSAAVDPVQALYEAHHSWLVARLRRKLGCAWDAADLAQNTFVRVPGTQRQQLQELLEPRAYLTTIAHRLLSNHLRRRQIERAYLDALALADPEAECIDGLICFILRIIL